MSEERFEELETQVREARQLADDSRGLAEANRLQLIRQEHRTISVWRNFWHYRLHGDQGEKEAALWAWLSWWVPGRSNRPKRTISYRNRRVIAVAPAAFVGRVRDILHLSP